MGKEEWWEKQRERFGQFTANVEGEELSDYQKRYYDRFVPDSEDALVIGCAKRQFSHLLVEKGMRVAAIDLPIIVEDLKEKNAKPECVYVGMNMDTPKEKDWIFDLIVSDNTMEHLIYDFQFVATIYDWLRDGGEAMVIVPDNEVRKQDRWHLRGYSLLSLKKLFKIAGFKIRELRDTPRGNMVVGEK